MPKVVRFIEASGENVAGLRKIEVRYGNVTELSGRNGEGKTTIGTLPVFVFWGKDLLGADYTKDKYSPRPSNYKYDRVYASIHFSVDGIEYKFAREIVGKTNSYYVNDVPMPAKEYEAAVAALFSQDEFMALYFPAYFFSLHWTKQRELLMTGLPAPLSKSVFVEMSRTAPDQAAKDIVLNPQATKLAELVKKHSLDDLQVMHKKQKPELEKKHIAAESRTKTLREQLDRLPAVTESVEVLEAQLAAAKAEFEKEDAVIAEAASINSRYTSLKAHYESLESQTKESFNAYPILRDEPIKDTCRACEQPLKPEDIEKVQADKDRRIDAYKAKHKDLQNRRDEAKAALAEAKWIDVAEQKAVSQALEAVYEAALDRLRSAKERARLSAEVEAAAAAETATLASLRESTIILDAIKAYRAKEAELQAAEIQSKFTKLSIRLFKYVASRGEYDPDFSVQMDGKDYAFLSTGEKVGAGLELTEVLFKQSRLITPVFIDGIGEYTGPIAAYDQVITGRAVPDQDLKIVVDGVEI
ncbi:ATPase [Paenibacillus sp. N4]|uniref:ATPase n=1 Tax=Paenibacillus vietnamensis TaxID=2590547 RepID=UPI001CD06E68|nr:ATPase [Paenibacillus vietnamensis]MCA0754873.1 ATPase [Paenibacillus vietnamensis]